MCTPVNVAGNLYELACLQANIPTSSMIQLKTYFPMFRLAQAKFE